jgi:hypothetical protein
VKLAVKPGDRGWLVAGVVILAADLIDERTLSESFRDFSRTRYGRVMTVTGWSLLTAHLFGVIPEKYDPFYAVFKRAPRRHRVVIVSV